MLSAATLEPTPKRVNYRDNPKESRSMADAATDDHGKAQVCVFISR